MSYCVWFFVIDVCNYLPFKFGVYSSDSRGDKFTFVLPRADFLVLVLMRIFQKTILRRFFQRICASDKNASVSRWKCPIPPLFFAQISSLTSNRVMLWFWGSFKRDYCICTHHFEKTYLKKTFFRFLVRFSKVNVSFSESSSYA